MRSLKLKSQPPRRSLDGVIKIKKKHFKSIGTAKLPFKSRGTFVSIIPPFAVPELWQQNMTSLPMNRKPCKIHRSAEFKNFRNYEILRLLRWWD